MLGFIDDDPRKAGIACAWHPGARRLFGAGRARQPRRRSIGSSSARASSTPNRLNELEGVLRAHGVALSRLHLGLEDLVVVTAEVPHTRPYIRRVEP